MGDGEFPCLAAGSEADRVQIHPHPLPQPLGRLPLLRTSFKYYMGNPPNNNRGVRRRSSHHRLQTHVARLLPGNGPANQENGSEDICVGLENWGPGKVVAA